LSLVRGASSEAETLFARADALSGKSEIPH
jgi:hypothetical protein